VKPRRQTQEEIWSRTLRAFSTYDNIRNTSWYRKTQPQSRSVKMWVGSPPVQLRNVV